MIPNFDLPSAQRLLRRKGQRVRRRIDARHRVRRVRWRGKREYRVYANRRERHYVRSHLRAQQTEPDFVHLNVDSLDVEYMWR